MKPSDLEAVSKLQVFPGGSWAARCPSEATPWLESNNDSPVSSGDFSAVKVSHHYGARYLELQQFTELHFTYRSCMVCMCYIIIVVCLWYDNLPPDMYTEWACTSAAWRWGQFSFESAWGSLDFLHLQLLESTSDALRLYYTRPFDPLLLLLAMRSRWNYVDVDDSISVNRTDTHLPLIDYTVTHWGVIGLLLSLECHSFVVLEGNLINTTSPTMSYGLTLNTLTVDFSAQIRLHFCSSCKFLRDILTFACFWLRQEILHMASNSFRSSW